MVSSDRFNNIDILRGFAALSVLVYHVIEHFHWQSFPADGPLVWFRAGWMGVDLFFVISGFVIALSAFREIERSGDQGFRPAFFKRRLARIVPLHYFTILIFVAFIEPTLLFQNFWSNLLSHLVFLHNLVPAFHGAINGSNWSVGTEMQFYVLMLFIAPWLMRGHWLGLATVFLAVSWGWRWLAYQMFGQAEVDVFKEFLVATQLPGMLDEFLAGIFLARWVRSDAGRAFMARGLVAYAVLLATAAVVLTFALNIYWKNSAFWNDPLMVIFWRSLLGFGFALLILSFIRLRLPGAFEFGLRPLSHLGVISYGIYLWHLPVLLALKRIEWISPTQVLTIAIPMVILLAEVSWRLIEKPLIEKFR